jgi:hypothetical protein
VRDVLAWHCFRMTGNRRFRQKTILTEGLEVLGFGF